MDDGSIFSMESKKENVSVRAPVWLTGSSRHQAGHRTPLGGVAVAVGVAAAVQFGAEAVADDGAVLDLAAADHGPPVKPSWFFFGGGGMYVAN